MGWTTGLGGMAGIVEGAGCTEHSTTQHSTTEHAHPSNPTQFDTATWHWEQLPVHGTAPSPRQGAAACLEGGRLWLVGGASNFVLDDVYCYQIERQAGWAGRRLLFAGHGYFALCKHGHGTRWLRLRACSAHLLGMTLAGVASGERGEQRWQACGAGQRPRDRTRRRRRPVPVWRQ